VQVFARLKPGYTAASAQVPAQGLFHQIREYEMTEPAAKSWSKLARDRFMQGTMNVERAATGYSQLRNDFSKALIILMCMVGLVLLIACANVANLLIARAFARQKEIAVRLSIGASRARLIRQLLTESLFLSFAGGVAGVALATVMTHSLIALIPSDAGPLLIRPEPDLRVLGFTFVLTILTGAVFGILPALRASRPDLWTTLKDAMGSIAGAGGASLLRKGLVTTQVALSFLLLFGAGLFVRSLENLKAKDTGFKDIENLVTFQLSPAMSGYNDERTVHFYNQLLDQLRGSPGVKSAALAAQPLLAGEEWDIGVSVEGHPAKEGENMAAFMNALSPGYFATMGIPLLEGRDFVSADVKENSKVVIINRAMAEHFFPGQSAVGRHLARDTGPNAKLDIEIIGVVENALYEGPRQGVRRQVFFPNWGKSAVAFYVRTSLPSTAAFADVRGQVKNLDGGMPVYELKTLSSQLDETLLTERLIALLSAGFGLLATLLAAVGLYGVMAFVVTRRTKEMGVRMSLGAKPGSVIWLVMKEVLLLLSIGLVIGAPAALGLGQLVGTQLYGIKANDPAIALTTVAILMTVAALAGLIPARRASRIDPILALRYE
jgi:predicted permease